MRVISALLQVYILGAGLVLASLLTIPPWGIYRSPVFQQCVCPTCPVHPHASCTRSKPVKWQEARTDFDVSDGKSKKKK